MDELIAAAHVLPPEKKYSSLPEEEKVALLTRELSNPRPLLSHDRSGAVEAKRVLDVFDVMRTAQTLLSPQAVTTYIISMTHGVSDMLEVLLLAKEVGLLRWSWREGEQHLESDIDVVPLFETIDDLQRCDGLMRSLYADAGVSPSSRRARQLPGDHARLFRQQQGRRVLRRQCDAVRHSGAARGGVQGRGCAHALLPRTWRDGGTRRRTRQSRDPVPAVGQLRWSDPLHGTGRDRLVPLQHAGARPPAHGADRQCRADRRERQDGATADQGGMAAGHAPHGTSARSPHIARSCTKIPNSGASIRRRRRSATSAGCRSHRGRHHGRGNSADSNRCAPFPGSSRGYRTAMSFPAGTGSAARCGTTRSSRRRTATLLATMYRDWLFFKMVINNAQLELLRSDLPTAAWYAQRVQPPELGTRMHDASAG